MSTTTSKQAVGVSVPNEFDNAYYITQSGYVELPRHLTYCLVILA